MVIADLKFFRDAQERPTAKRLLDHPFCFIDPTYSFHNTVLGQTLEKLARPKEDQQSRLLNMGKAPPGGGYGLSAAH
jgi:hypothetical protein